VQIRRSSEGEQEQSEGRNKNTKAARRIISGKTSLEGEKQRPAPEAEKALIRELYDDFPATHLQDS
jgi:hypothetical protein